MNRQLLGAIQQHIAHTKAKVDMHVWVSRPVGAGYLECTVPQLVNSTDAELDHMVDDCGTAGCIAGWAVLLDRDRAHAFVEHMLNEGASYVGFGELARDLLELPDQQSTELFHTEWWPDPIALVYRASRRLGALLAIDYLLLGPNFGDLIDEPGDYDWAGFFAWCRLRVGYWVEEHGVSND